MTTAEAPKNHGLSVGTIFLSMLVALVSGAAGAFLGAAAASAYAAAMKMSNMEGARGYFAIAIGLLVGLGLMISATIFTLHRRGARGVWLLLGLGVTMLSLVATAAGGLGLYYLSQPQILNANAAPVQLQVQLAGPANSTREKLLALEAELNTNLNSATIYWRKEEGESAGATLPMIEGYVDLYFRTSTRTIVLELPNKEKRLFALKLPANPKSAKYKQWSDWQGASFIDRPDLQNPIRAAGDPDYKIRYRVELPGE